MKVVALVVGALAIILGGVWILQGFNVLPGSFMTGDIRWAIYGAMLAAGGAVLVVWSRRR